MTDPVTHPLLVIVDGHALAYRAFYALPPLLSPEGKPTGAILGFLRKIFQIMREKQPAAIAVVFDGPGPTFRDKISEAYKATREPMPTDLREQIETLLTLVPALGIKTLCLPEVEADDVIATLALQASQTARVEILSGDKDLASIVSDSITMLAGSRDFGAETRLDPKGVEAKFGIPPSAIPDYLTLVGDASDNIPGVAGIGAKTAAKLLQEHGTLEAILKNQASLPPKVKNALDAHRDALELSRRLVALRRDLDLGSEDPLQMCARKLAPTPAARETLQKLSLKTVLAELPAEETAPAPAAAGLSVPPPEILNARTLPGFLKKLSTAAMAVVDTETTSLDPHAADLVGVSFAMDGHPPAYLPMQDAGSDLVEPFLKYLRDPKPRRCGHHVKYDYQVLKRFGADSVAFAFDTMIASSLLNPLRNSQSLDSLAKDLYGMEKIPFSSLGDDLRITPVEKLAEYSCEDAFVTLELYRKFSHELKERGFEKLYREIEHPISQTLAEMEWRGVRVSRETLAEQSQTLSREMEQLRAKALEAAGEDFNPASSQQLGRILFEKLGLPTKRKTKTGFSTDAATLEELRGTHPLPELILEYREVAKLLNTYIDALPAMINPLTGRLHTSFSQVRTATGRLSSSDPNLQNIPIRTERGRAIRRAFIADRGKTLITADYSQIEFRIAAFMAQEKPLLAAFEKGDDLHAATASLVWGMPVEAVDRETRRKAKAVNYGLLYGQTAFGLARSLGIGRSEAQSLIDGYFAALPAMKAWIDATLETARAAGEVATHFGRRRPIPDLKSSNRNIREAAERIAINTPVQGTAAELMKLAMLGVEDRLAKLPDAGIILQVHDELVVEAKGSDVEAVKTILSEEMMRIPPFEGHLAVSVGAGTDWLEASH